MIDGWGDTVTNTEDEDLTFLSKHTFWRVGHSLLHFTNKVVGVDWDQVWNALTGDSVKMQTISGTDESKPIDFVELFNPGNFAAPPRFKSRLGSRRNCGPNR